MSWGGGLHSFNHFSELKFLCVWGGGVHFCTFIRLFLGCAPMWARNTTCQIRLQTSDFIPIAVAHLVVALITVLSQPSALLSRRLPGAKASSRPPTPGQRTPWPTLAPDLQTASFKRQERKDNKKRNKTFGSDAVSGPQYPVTVGRVESKVRGVDSRFGPPQ